MDVKITESLSCMVVENEILEHDCIKLQCIVTDVFHRTTVSH